MDWNLKDQTRAKKRIKLLQKAKKDSSEEGNEGYSYVSGQANLKAKVPQEMNSTSSNDENEPPKAHMCLQKPRPKKKIISPTEKRELCRKKLIERSKSKSFKVKALVHHIPTDKDINNLFKEFTVDFLLKGYSTLITTLRLQLTTEENPDIDKSHFLWLITYFLKFASQLEVQLEQIGPVLTVETVAFLTFEGVRFYEELELAVREQKDRPVSETPLEENSLGCHCAKRIYPNTANLLQFHTFFRGRQSPAEPHSNRSVQYERFEAIVFAAHSTLQCRNSNQTISQ